VPTLRLKDEACRLVLTPGLARPRSTSLYLKPRHRVSARIVIWRFAAGAPRCYFRRHDTVVRLKPSARRSGVA